MRPRSVTPCGSMPGKEFDPASAKNDQLVPRIIHGPGAHSERSSNSRLLINRLRSISERRIYGSFSMRKKEEIRKGDIFLMDLSLCANPEVFFDSFTRGTRNDTPLRCWPLGRRSGCFPALPCPPPRPSALSQN